VDSINQTPTYRTDGAHPAPSARTVLFLCTGNYYRSRFAEILFNAVAEKAGVGWQATSRGLAIEWCIDNVGPMSVHTTRRLGALGVSTERYLRLPLQVSESDLARADLIVALKEAEHRPMLQERHPTWVDRVEYWHVHDLDFAAACDALAEIERHVHGLAARLVRERDIRSSRSAQPSR
jgi:protein-tyrosine phosphatase